MFHGCVPLEINLYMRSSRDLINGRLPIIGSELGRTASKYLQGSTPFEKEWDCSPARTDIRPCRLSVLG